MDVEDVTRELYGRLFFLPSLPKLVLIYIALLVAIGLVNAFPPGTLHSITISVEQYMILGATFVGVFLFLNISRVFTFKRILGIATAMFLASLPAELIFYRLTGFKGTGILAGTGLIYIILSAFFGMTASIAIASLPPLAAFYIVNSIMNKGVPSSILLGAIVTEMVSLLAGVLYLSYFESRGRASGYSPMKMVRAFLRTWFTGDPTALEEAFAQKAVDSDLLVRTMILWREGGDPIALVFPTLHYGIFREVGSARFIYHLEDVLEPEFKLFTFHTAGSHEHNLVSSSDSIRIAKIIGDEIRRHASLNPRKNLLCRPYRVRVNGGWESFTLCGPNALALMIVNREVGNDDLPASLWDRLMNDPRAPSFIAVADSHSFKGDSVDSVDILEPLINEVFRKYSCVNGEEFLAGYGEARLKGMCRCVCSPRVKALTLNFGGDRYAIVYIYGNNMDGSYRLRLESMIKKHGFKDVEVVTPDDHSCAASFKEAPYDVVSECPPLTKAVIKAVEEAVRNEFKASYSVHDILIRNVRFVGDGILSLMDQLGRLGRRAERMILALILAINTAPIVIYSLVLGQGSVIP